MQALYSSKFGWDMKSGTLELSCQYCTWIGLCDKEQWVQSDLGPKVLSFHSLQRRCSAGLLSHTSTARPSWKHAMCHMCSCAFWQSWLSVFPHLEADSGYEEDWMSTIWANDRDAEMGCPCCQRTVPTKKSWSNQRPAHVEVKLKSFPQTPCMAMNRVDAEWDRRAKE